MPASAFHHPSFQSSTGPKIVWLRCLISAPDRFRHHIVSFFFPVPGWLNARRYLILLLYIALCNCLLPTSHCLLPTTPRPLSAARPLTTVYCLLLIAHCLLPATHRPLSKDNYSLSTAQCLPAVYCPLSAAYCPLLTAYHPLFTVHYHCPLLAANCPLPDVGYAWCIFAAS
jgi:hypothetical protein